MASVAFKISLWYATVTLLICVLYASSMASAEVGAKDKLAYSLEEQNPAQANEVIGNALINYLLERRLDSRNPNIFDMNDMKRSSYYKQCSFNAVSCFGKRK